MTTRPIVAGIAAAASALLLLAGCASTSSPAEDQSPTASEQVYTPIVASVLAPPHATSVSDGKVHLAYELLLSNMISQPVTIDSVTAKADDRQLQQLKDDALIPQMRVYGATEATRVIGPGQQALVFMNVIVDSLDDVPSEIEHELAIAPERAVEPVFGSPMIEDVAPVTPVEDTPIVIGPPLKGAGWLDGNSCCDVTPHRGAINPINGKLWAPERYGIDFVQLDDKDATMSGPPDELSSYPYYGADIIAVGDGPIVSMEWDLEEQTPGTNPTDLPVDAYGGNNIVQDLGGGHYAFYAHLQGGNPEGLKVGQMLSKGDLIGALGNTGNSGSPHLHFHIMDSPLPLASDGLPFLIDSFDLAGRVTSTESLETCAVSDTPCEVSTATAGERSGTSPLYLDVLDFAD